MSTDPATLAELADHGLTTDDDGRSCPLATERRGLNDARCWLRSDLVGLLADGQPSRGKLVGDIARRFGAKPVDESPGGLT